MAKKKQAEDAPRLVPHEDLVRQSISTGLIQMGHMIHLQANGLASLMELNGCRAISGKEEQFLGEALEKLERVEKIVLTIGRRNQRARS